ncbi:MAG: hypothetical protein WKF75_21525 [Singulisphaera sp.]
MNWSLGHFSSKARVVDLGGLDVIAVAEDLVEGQQRGGHPAAGAEHVAPGPPLPTRGAFGEGGHAGLVFFLLGRLRRRNELLIRGDPRRDRRAPLVPGVELTLADPHDRPPRRRWSGIDAIVASWCIATTAIASQ